MAVTGLYTTLRNMSGMDLTFPFLPPHGASLSAGEQVTIFGDVASRIGNNRRKKAAYENAIDTGNLVIVSTPAVYLYDDSRDETKVLTLDGGALGSADPAEGPYSSSA